MKSAVHLTGIERLLDSKSDVITKVQTLGTTMNRCEICDKIVFTFNRKRPQEGIHDLSIHFISSKHRANLQQQIPQNNQSKDVSSEIRNFETEWAHSYRVSLKLKCLWYAVKNERITKKQESLRNSNKDLKRQRRQLEVENTKLKAALSEYLEIAEDSKATAKLRRQYEECRAAAIALKEVGCHLPSATLDVIEWAKDDSVHFTQRSKELNDYRLNILKQPKYAVLGKNEYLIENNPLNDEEVGHYQFEENILNVMKEFVVKNEGAGNLHPEVLVNRRWMKYEPLDNVLGFRTIDPSNCVHLCDPKVLEGQRECYAKLDIPNGTILGQYVGNEMTQSEYHKIYNGTREEMRHLSYMHGDTFVLPDGQRIDIHVDGIGAGDTSPFLYINDGRANIREKETAEDAKRMNVEFIGVLCNGWPMILTRSTKAIRAGQSLWINYGPRFDLVLDEHDLVKQQRDRMQESFDNILAGVNLEEGRGLEIFSDSEDDDVKVTPIKNGTSSHMDLFRSEVPMSRGQRRKRNKRNRLKRTKCFNCNELGHKKFNCPKKNRRGEVEHLTAECIKKEAVDDAQTSIDYRNGKRPLQVDGVECSSDNRPTKKQRL